MRASLSSGKEKSHASGAMSRAIPAASKRKTSAAAALQRGQRRLEANASCRGSGVNAVRAASSTRASASSAPTPTSPRESVPQVAVQHASEKFYDVVLLGKVFTGVGRGDDAFAECVAWGRQAGTIVFVGTHADLQSRTLKGELEQASWSRIFQVSGLVMPAFHDAHCHPFGAGNRLRRSVEQTQLMDEMLRCGAIDLSACSTLASVQAQLQEAVTTKGSDSSTLFAENCDPEHFECKRDEIGRFLESISPGRALVVLLGKGSPEAVAVNDTAMRALSEKCASWNFDSDDTRIIRHRAGAPTGFFVGGFWATRFALLSEASFASQGFRGLLDGLLELPRHGIVACTDAFVFEDRIPCYELAVHEDCKRKLPRVSLALGFKEEMPQKMIHEMLARAPNLRRNWEATDHRLCLREAKVEVDHMLHWSSNNARSKPAWDLQKLDQVVHGMVGADYSMHMHVFGDLAAQHSIKTLLAAEAASESMIKPKSICKMARSLPSQGMASEKVSGRRRHKLAHVFDLRTEDEALLCQYPSIHVVYQPLWFQSGYRYRSEVARSHSKLRSGGASVCYGSDWDISEVSPLQGVRAALITEEAFDTQESWPERLAQAVKVQTLDSSRAMWLEHCSGTIEVGKSADLCLLDRDLWAVPEEAFRNTKEPLQVKVVATFSRGFCIFKPETPEGSQALARYQSRPQSRTEARRSQLRSSTKAEDDFLFGTCGCAIPRSRHRKGPGFCAAFGNCSARRT